MGGLQPSFLLQAELISKLSALPMQILEIPRDRDSIISEHHSEIHHDQESITVMVNNVFLLSKNNFDLQHETITTWPFIVHLQEKLGCI